MQCFMCMTYVFFVCNALPSGERDPAIEHEKRSLFRDVIESLKIRSQIPDDFNQNEENNLAQNYVRYGYENEPQLQNDAEFMPRRNDRIEMPSMKYRYPKSIENSNDSKSKDETDNRKEEIVVYISTTREPKPVTPKTKRPQKRPAPPAKYQTKDDEEIAEEAETQSPEESSQAVPLTNMMTGQSQIGNRESQIVLKPTVIVNFRGTVSHRDSDIRLAGRKTDRNGTKSIDTPQNIFNIRQEVKLDRTLADMKIRGQAKKPGSKEDVEGKEVSKSENTDMMMCETATWSSETNARGSRKYDNVFEIFFSV